MKRIGLSLLAVVMMAGCATLSNRAKSIHDADATAIGKCKYLGEVYGSSGWGNLAASKGMQNAMNEAREQAAKMGATHVVWGGVAGGYSPHTNGKAYLCQ